MKNENRLIITLIFCVVVGLGILAFQPGEIRFFALLIPYLLLVASLLTSREGNRRSASQVLLLLIVFLQTGGIFLAGHLYSSSSWAMIGITVLEIPPLTGTLLLLSSRS